MPTYEASREFDASPESIWRIVLAYTSWPEWSPLFQLVRPEAPEQGLQGEWTLHGLLGRIPYNGLFRQIEHRPLEHFTFASITASTPYDFVRQTVQLDRQSRPLLTWQVHYTTSGGPGGSILNLLLIRRQTPELLDRHLEALAAALA